MPQEQSSKPDGWPWLQAEVRTAAAAFAQQVRQVPAGSTAVPNLDWDVRELAAHVASLPDFYRQLNEASEPFERPDDFPTFSRQVRAHLDDHDHLALADLIESEADTLLDRLGPDGSAPWQLYLPTTAANTAAGYLGELLMHGMDLNPITGQRTTMTSRQGHAIVQQTMALTPFFVDRQAASRCTGTYHLWFQGGADFDPLHYTWVIDDGILRVGEGRPPRADARMRADPATFVLVSLERMSQIRAGLTGRIVAYGRKPWRFAALGTISIDGV